MSEWNFRLAKYFFLRGTRKHQNLLVVIIIVAILILIWAITHTAKARDLGQYVQMPPELREWFGKLQSKKNILCCADADGYDAQWDTKGDHYIVFSPDGWVDVPDEAVVTVPNKAGVAKVWWYWDGEGHKTRKVRCFMPGTQT